MRTHHTRSILHPHLLRLLPLLLAFPTAGRATSDRELLDALRDHESYTYRHALVTGVYAARLAAALGLDSATVGKARRAGFLHDIGKTLVPLAILDKPGKLDDLEWEVIKRHPGDGADRLASVGVPEDIVAGVRHHHERWDGTGYPGRLAGESIPLMGRILAVADAFSAMTVDRPYRRALELPEVWKRMREGRGTQFDPRVLDAFLPLAHSLDREAARLRSSGFQWSGTP